MRQTNERPARFSRPPLGTSGDLRRRVLVHHAPLAFATAMALLLWMHLPIFETAGHQGPPAAALQSAAGHEPPAGAGGHSRSPQANHEGQTDHGSAGIHTPDETQRRRFMGRLTTGTGYIALGLLAITLLIGPANILLGRRNPVSNHLRRDVGAWAAGLSVVHTITGLGVHGPAGALGERISHYFFAADGSVLTNSFGLGNWTGLAATVIVVGLLAISSDYALWRLGAGPWKGLQRLNYALFALVVVHAVFYGALSRITSASTILLGLSVVTVFVGQGVGIWLWRRRHSRSVSVR